MPLPLPPPAPLPSLPSTQSDDEEIEIVGVHFAPPPLQLPQGPSQREAALTGATVHQAAAPPAPSSVIPPVANNSNDEHSKPPFDLRSQMLTALCIVLVNITIHFTKPLEKRPKSTVKEEVTKTEYLTLTAATSRAEFIAECLHAHGLQDNYQVGLASGPRFLMVWKGSRCVALMLSLFCSNETLESGGKNGKTTIDTNHNFIQALSTVWKKKKDSRQINVSFDLEVLKVYWREQVCALMPAQLTCPTLFQSLDALQDDNAEAVTGTQVRRSCNPEITCLCMCRFLV